MKAWQVLAGGAAIAGGYWLYQKSKQQGNSGNNSSVGKTDTGLASVLSDIKDVGSTLKSVTNDVSSIFASAKKIETSTAQPRNTDTNSTDTTGILGDAPPDNTAAGQADSGNPLFDQSNYSTGDDTSVDA